MGGGGGGVRGAVVGGTYDFCGRLTLSEVLGSLAGDVVVDIDGPQPWKRMSMSMLVVEWNVAGVESEVYITKIVSVFVGAPRSPQSRCIWST